MKDSAKKLFAAIEARKTVDLDRFIFGLGIRQVGETTARLLARHFGSLETMRDTALQIAGGDMLARADLEALDGVGGTMLDAFVAFFEEPHNLESLDAMLAAGVNPMPLKRLPPIPPLPVKPSSLPAHWSAWVAPKRKPAPRLWGRKS